MPLKKNASTSRTILIILALALFIVALTLVILTSLDPKFFSGKQGGSFAEGYKAAREQAAAFAPVGSLQPVRITEGTVTSKQGSALTVETHFFVNERVDGIGNTREVTLAENGKVKIQKQKPANVLAVEMLDYKEKLESYKGSGPRPLPPSPFETVDGSMEDIQKGDLISVYGASDDIRYESHIVALEIGIVRR